jgi:hypothetical protein
VRPRAVSDGIAGLLPTLAASLGPVAGGKGPAQQGQGGALGVQVGEALFHVRQAQLLDSVEQVRSFGHVRVHAQIVAGED